LNSAITNNNVIKKKKNKWIKRIIVVIVNFGPSGTFCSRDSARRAFSAYYTPFRFEIIYLCSGAQRLLNRYHPRSYSLICGCPSKNFTYASYYLRAARGFKNFFFRGFSFFFFFVVAVVVLPVGIGTNLSHWSPGPITARTLALHGYNIGCINTREITTGGFSITRSSVDRNGRSRCWHYSRVVTAEFAIRAFPFSKTGSEVLSGGVGRDPKFLVSRSFSPK